MAFEEDEVGAIDTGDESAGLDMSRRAPAQEDNSGMGPVGAIDTGEDNSGMGPVAAGAAGPDGSQMDHIGPNGPIMRNLRAFPGNARRIISYLMGEGAADPGQLNAVGAQVDPEGRMSPDDRNVLAVQKVAQDQGPEAAWKLVQANRVAYNAKQAFAYAALNGTPQKRPDLNAAIDAANQAASHVLDGSSVQFSPGQGGITATVSAPGSDRPQTFQLSIDAFRRYLNVGGAGQYDRVMEQSVPKTLAALARGGGQGISRLDQARPLPRQAQEETPEDTGPTEAIPTEETNFGKTPSTMNLSGNNKVQYGSNVQTPFENASLEERADQMFPRISQSDERNRWMAGEMAREASEQNKIDVATEKGQRDIEKARATGQYRVQGEQIKAEASTKNTETKAGAWRYASDAKKAAAQIAADQRAAHEGNVDARNRIENARKAIATKRATATQLTPEEEKFEKMLTEQGMQAAPRQQAPRQAPQQQAPARPSGPPPEPGAKFFNGNWYRRGPNGEAQRIQ